MVQRWSRRATKVHHGPEMVQHWSNSGQTTATRDPTMIPTLVLNYPTVVQQGPTLVRTGHTGAPYWSNSGQTMATHGPTMIPTLVPNYPSMVRHGPTLVQTGPQRFIVVQKWCKPGRTARRVSTDIHHDFKLPILGSNRYMSHTKLHSYSVVLPWASDMVGNKATGLYRDT